jgi:hypothetical protein
MGSSPDRYLHIILINLNVTLEVNKYAIGDTYILIFSHDWSSKEEDAREPSSDLSFTSLPWVA